MSQRKEQRGIMTSCVHTARTHSSAKVCTCTCCFIWPLEEKFCKTSPGKQTMGAESLCPAEHGLLPLTTSGWLPLAWATGSLWVPLLLVHQTCSRCAPRRQRVLMLFLSCLAVALPCTWYFSSKTSPELSWVLHT